MKSGDSFIQGYNAQAAVDSHRQIIMAQHLTNNGSDMHQMIPSLKQIRTHLGRQAKKISAESGYCSGLKMKTLQKRNILGNVAKTLHRTEQKSRSWDTPIKK